MNMTDINLLILDVDGVLTDGRVAFAAEGEAAKSFCVQDGCAIRLWMRSGGRVAILSGRSEQSVVRRAAELGIETVRTGVADKRSGYREIRDLAGCDDRVVAYMGDDLPDLGPMSQCGLAVAVADAAPSVKRAADYVTRRRGGTGAVAEVVELLLRKKNRWSRALAEAGW